ncbi:hypothetical protein ACJ73_02385 [Blastomyces percursus]|uniref:Uncharacterized protein n=1 Tax=Blastomyces percursus TaxID=1658174 RepID=A0A1J9QCQ4_9EURO|nr:hypothetical protein ACJ73_02385 [Blastomyces percursus]
MVRFRIKHGADPQAPFPAHHGGYPLHVASCSGPAGLVRLLLEHGAEVDVRNSKGWTPLYCAIRPLLSPAEYVPHKRKRVAPVRVRWLLDYGADPDPVTKAGESPSLLAKRCRDLYGQMILLGGKWAKVSLHEPRLDGRCIWDDPPLKELGWWKEGVRGKRWCELDKNVTSTSMALGPVVGSKSKRPRKRTKKDRKMRRKKQLQAGEGDGEGKGEVKEAVEIGVAEQDSTAPVRLVNLNDNTANATARRKSAWAKLRAEACQR